ncbi:hypothetical protein pb186bvf_011234 [Paramecium bursaria]
MQNRIQYVGQYYYNADDILNQGFNSTIYLGRGQLDNQQVAIKVIVLITQVFDMSKFRNDIERHLMQQEINALQILNSPNIVRMLDFQKNDQHTHIVMEYCNQGDLGSFLELKGFLQEKDAISIFKHIITGFKEQINKGIIHRDLKPKNILIHNGLPKIADYGFSKMMNAPPDRVYYNVGTTLYMSPQALIENKYSEKSDVWSLGVLFYQILIGRPPWTGDTDKEFIRNISTIPVQFPQDRPLSPFVIDFITRCLIVNEDQRLNVQQMVQHQLFQFRGNLLRERDRSNQLIQSFHIQRGATQKVLLSTDFGGKRVTTSVTPRNNDHQEQIKNKLIEKVDKIIQQQIYFLKFCVIVAKIIGHFNFLNTYTIKEKLMFFIIKNALNLSNKLKLMINSKQNTLNIENFSIYIQTMAYLKFSKDIYFYNNKFETSFNKFWLNIQSQYPLQTMLLQDFDFQRYFDQTDNINEYFYIYYQKILQQAIKELQVFMQSRVMSNPHYEITSEEDVAGVILLDYLVTMLKLCDLNRIYYGKTAQIAQLTNLKTCKHQQKYIIFDCQKDK